MVSEVSRNFSYPQGTSQWTHSEFRALRATEPEEFAVCPNLDNGVPLQGMKRACVCVGEETEGGDGVVAEQKTTRNRDYLSIRGIRG